MSNDTENNGSQDVSSVGRQHSPEQIAAYHLDLERLLGYVESAANHYEALGLDELATTGEVKLAYTRAAALLHPSFYNLDLPQPDEFLSRIDQAFEKISNAYAVLVNFNRRVEYDDQLFQRQDSTTDALSPQPADGEGQAERVAERRHEQRFQLSLPVRVSGHTRDGGKWQEMTQTVDVSSTGALVNLLMPVSLGMILNISMPMPTTLRNHAFFEADYTVYAIVRRLHAAGEETTLVGVEFFSDEPPAAYFDEPYAIFNTATETGKERRAGGRIKSSRAVTVEYLDEALQVISQEEAFTEDLSKTGIRVCVQAIPDAFSVVRISGQPGTPTNVATVTGRYVGDDGVERLCLKFVEE